MSRKRNIIPIIGLSFLSGIFAIAVFPSTDHRYSTAESAAVRPQPTTPVGTPVMPPTKDPTKDPKK